MDLVALSDFHAVAASGGFGAASRATGTPKATLSRRVRSLEAALAINPRMPGGAERLKEQRRKAEGDTT